MPLLEYHRFTMHKSCMPITLHDKAELTSLSYLDKRFCKVDIEDRGASLDYQWDMQIFFFQQQISQTKTALFVF